MLDAAALRSLADLDGPERAFLTIYLDAGDDPSVIDARATRVRALLSDQPAELEHFEESLTMAREMVETHAPTEGALAVFASWAADRVPRNKPSCWPTLTRRWRLIETMRGWRISFSNCHPMPGLCLSMPPCRFFLGRSPESR